MIKALSARWSFLLTAASVLAADPLPPPSTVPDATTPAGLETYRRFAVEQDGNEARGQALFADAQRLACAKCHSIDGKGALAGPDLATVGDQFSRADLVNAVLHPSAAIAVGYATTIVETRAGEEFLGVLKQATDTEIELAGADGQRTRIAKDRIAQQRGSAVSLMPEGLCAGLTLQEFADLIEHLVSLKEPMHAQTSQQGMPETIPPLQPPAALRPFLTEPLPVLPAKIAADRHVQSGLVWAVQLPGRPHRFLAVEQSGIIWHIDKTPTGDRRTVFLDITPEVFSARGPNGLLGMALHPKFAQNHKYYLKHQVFENQRIATVLVERRASADFSADSGQPPNRLLKIEAVAEHHNGGCIQFGPDGFLYFGMGDSAPNHDPQGQAQDLGLLFGKLLRLDVDHRDADLAYAIPKDNPFREQLGARPEIWAWGLREPWRFSFDPANGDLWVADLGQERGDEVARVRRGENHGWNVYQGFELFSPQHRRQDVTYTPPLFSTRRRHGSAIVGGYVYRGDPRSSFQGVYVFGDYTSKRIWGLTHQHGTLQTVRELAVCPQSITAFTVDEAGQLYVVGQQGMIYQLDLSGTHWTP